MSKGRGKGGSRKRSGSLARRGRPSSPVPEIPWRRFGAYVIDWILSGLFIGLPEVFIFPLVTRSTDLFSDLYVFSAMGYSAGWAYLCCALSLVLFFVYYVAVPLWVWPGQTPGKRLMHQRVERMSGSKLTLQTLLLREMVGLLLIEGVGTIMTRYLLQTVTLLSGVYVDGVVGAVGYGLTIVSGVLVVATRHHRAIHDYLAGTRVVDC